MKLSFCTSVEGHEGKRRRPHQAHIQLQRGRTDLRTEDGILQTSPARAKDPKKYASRNENTMQNFWAKTKNVFHCVLSPFTSDTLVGLNARFRVKVDGATPNKGSHDGTYSSEWSPKLPQLQPTLNPRDATECGVLLFSRSFSII